MQPVQKLVLTPRIIHAALMASTLLYVFIGWQLCHGGADAPQPLDPVLLYTLGAVALSTMVIIPVLRKRLLPPMREPSSTTDVPAEGSAAPGSALARYMSASIVSWALCESISIMGLVLTILSRQMTHVLVFTAACLVNLALYAPRRGDIEAVLRAEQAK